MAPTGGALYAAARLASYAWASLRAASVGAGSLVFFADGSAVGVATMLGGAACAGYVATYFVRWRLGARYAELLRYNELFNCFDVARASLSIARLALVAWVAATVVILRASVVATPTELRVTRFLSPERRYAFTDIVRLEVSDFVRDPEGRRTFSRECVVHFRDGTRLGSRFLPDGELHGRTDGDLVVFLTEKSGVPWTRVESLLRSDLL